MLTDMFKNPCIIISIGAFHQTIKQATIQLKINEKWENASDINIYIYHFRVFCIFHTYFLGISVIMKH